MGEKAKDRRRGAGAQRGKAPLLAYRVDEQRAMLAHCLVHCASYWAAVPEYSIEKKLSGFCHSAATNIDGCGSLPSILVAERGELAAGREGMEKGLFDEAAKRMEASEDGRLTAIRFACVGEWEPSFGGEDERGADPFFGRVKAAQLRWGRQAAATDMSGREAAQGLALSWAAILEGAPGCGAGYFLAACPHESDKAFHQKEGERWHERPAEDDDAVRADIAGGLRYSWSRRWEEGGAMEREAEAAMAALDERAGLESALPQGAPAKPKPRV